MSPHIPHVSVFYILHSTNNPTHILIMERVKLDPTFKDVEHSLKSKPKTMRKESYILLPYYC